MKQKLTREQVALEVLWRARILENLAAVMDRQHAHDYVTGEFYFYPYDDKSCAVYSHDSGWWLYTGSGTRIVDVIELGNIFPFPIDGGVMKKQIRELIDMMNGCEIVSDQYEGCVAVKGDHVLRHGAIIDTLDTDEKVMTLWNELVRQELGDVR